MFKEKKQVASIRIEPWRKTFICSKYGGLQRWVDLLIEEEFAGSTEAVIIKLEPMPEDVRPEDF